MTLATARAWLAEHAPDLEIIEVEESTATVAEAAAALGVEFERIAKTLAIKIGERVILLVARGDARLDNAKCKAAFGSRPRMLGAEEAFAATGHPVGGICPFGLATRGGLLRRDAARVRRGVSGRRVTHQLGPGLPRAAVRTGRGRVGGRMPVRLKIEVEEA